MFLFIAIIVIITSRVLDQHCWCYAKQMLLLLVQYRASVGTIGTSQDECWKCWQEARRGSKFATDLPPLAVALQHQTRPHPEHWIILTMLSPCACMSAAACKGAKKDLICFVALVSFLHNTSCQLQECFATCLKMVLIILNLQVVTGLLCLANCTFGCYAAFKEVFKLTWLVVLISYVFLAVSREIQKLS